MMTSKIRQAATANPNVIQTMGNLCVRTHFAGAASRGLLMKSGHVPPAAR